MNNNSYDDNNNNNNSLDLGLGLTTTTTTTTQKPNTKPQQQASMLGGPCLTLSLSGERSPASSVAVSVKRERETSNNSSDDDDEGEEENGSCVNMNNNNNINMINNVNNNNSGSRKKLRLNKNQSAMLEESFKLQSTLNPKQKQALAERLDLLPRQVEVWFQNRRARTKLKQTEVDCEYMKKWCETLTEENKRLHKEIQELKALKLVQPFYMNLPTTTLSMCPSCEKIGSGVPIIGTPVPISNKKALVMGSSKSHFYSASPNRPLLVDN